MPHRPPPTTAPWLLALAGALIAAVNCAGSLAYLDGGDFVASAVTLGVPHPTGFPILTGLGNVFAQLPVGSLPFRIALLSAACTGLTIFALSDIARHLCGSTAAAMGAGMGGIAATLVVPTVALHARVPEAYALHIACIAMALRGFIRAESRGDARALATAAVFVGIGLANHGAFRAIAPLLIGASFVGLRRAGFARGTWLGFAALTALPLLAYGYLWVSASSGAIYAFDAPDTPARALRHANAEGIVTLFRDQMFPPPRVAFAHLANLLHQLGPSFPLLWAATWLTTVLASMRSMWLARWTSVIVALLVFDILYAAFVNPMGIPDAQNGQLAGFLAYACVGTLASAFMARRASVAGLSRRPALAAGAVAAGLLITLQPGDGRARVADDHLNDERQFLGFATAPRDAAFFPRSDNAVGASLYHHAVLAARPDVLYAPRYELVGVRVMRRRLAYQPGGAEIARALAAEPAADVPAASARVIAAVRAAGRPIRWEVIESGTDIPPDLGAELGYPWSTIVAEAGLHERCDGSADSLCAARGGFAMAQRTAEGRFHAGLLVARDWDARARARLITERDPARAAPAFAEAARLAPSRSVFWENWGYVEAGLGRPIWALRLVDEAIERDATNDHARGTARRICGVLGDLACRERYLPLMPHD